MLHMTKGLRFVRCGFCGVALSAVSKAPYSKVCPDCTRIAPNADVFGLRGVRRSRLFTRAS